MIWIIYLIGCVIAAYILFEKIKTDEFSDCYYTLYVRHGGNMTILILLIASIIIVCSSWAYVLEVYFNKRNV